MSTLIKLKRFTNNKPSKLEDGEPIYDKNNKVLFIGDGSSTSDIRSTLRLAKSGAPDNLLMHYDKIGDFPKPGCVYDLDGKEYAINYVPNASALLCLDEKGEVIDVVDASAYIEGVAESIGKNSEDITTLKQSLNNTITTRLTWKDLDKQ